MSIETLAAIEDAISAHIKDNDSENALISWVIFFEAFSHMPEQHDGIVYHVSYAASAGASPSASVGVATLGHKALMNDLQKGSE